MGKTWFRWTRRGVLRGGIGAAGVIAGLGRPLWASPPAPVSFGKRARALILLWMNGGPSHLDTFDPKPGTPEGGPFRAIPTAVAGMQFCEHLPHLAAQAGRLAVVRSVTSREGDHQRAIVYVRTGHPLTSATAYPGLGAVLSRERSGANALPVRAISLLAPGTEAGFLGSEYAPLLVVDPEKPLEGWFPDGYSPETLARRTVALDELERATLAGQPGGKLEAEHRRVGALARELLGSRLVAALDLKTEPERMRKGYGSTPFGQGCLLARRLVEAGVSFVEVTLDGWDSHVENFTAHQRLLSTLDPAFSALLSDLAARGLLDSTVVLWAGEFGRTPTINAQRGRDHHPHAFSAVLAGGPVRGGQVIGATDARGADVTDRSVPVPDLLASVYSALGIAPDKQYVTPDDRPVNVLDGASPVPGLLDSR